ncbi:MAG: GNAT family N-acetyltransferase [Pseudomonadota bacterium]|nr:GNAT family N-acetyltransferase [Pseudomonadota bacterium]
MSYCALNDVIVIQADLHEDSQAHAVVELINLYAQGPLGQGQALPATVQQQLIPQLSAHPTAYVFLAYYQHQPIGVAVSFLGFSTWAAQPLMNIHDLMVKVDFRNQGVGHQLLVAIERKARALGCCQLTLEVREDNQAAQQLYNQFGFTQSQPAMLFWQKKFKLR